ncbi:hypothetical protein CC78DRAFT_599269 [Lojkania enalia]|uniref:Uncharacterized protein n=1 Tax=Lojkania enalia TaxID=147567 RepID=A0A9P4K1D3_9PLEO|nr:hypothetical protein CC78DRAFT_599269 [Didymosphaeria enalia]
MSSASLHSRKSKKKAHGKVRGGKQSEAEQFEEARAAEMRQQQVEDRAESMVEVPPMKEVPAQGINGMGDAFTIPEELFTQIVQVRENLFDESDEPEFTLNELADSMVSLAASFRNAGIDWRLVTPPSILETFLKQCNKEPSNKYVIGSRTKLTDSLLEPLLEQTAVLREIPSILGLIGVNLSGLATCVESIQDVNLKIEKINTELGLASSAHKFPLEKLVQVGETESHKEKGQLLIQLRYLMNILGIPGVDVGPLKKMKQPPPETMAKLQKFALDAILGLENVPAIDPNRIKALKATDFHIGTDVNLKRENNEGSGLFVQQGATEQQVGQSAIAGQDVSSSGVPSFSHGPGEPSTSGNVPRRQNAESVEPEGPINGDYGDDPPVYSGTEEDHPQGSATVAYGKSRGGIYYINRIGPPAACIFVEADNPVKDGSDIDWDSPPAHLNVTNPNNRLGEKRLESGAYAYTKRHIAGIWGVSYKMDKNPFPELPVYEAMNQRNYENHNKTLSYGEKPLRFIGCHVCVGWRLPNGQIVKSWELRGALQASQRWKTEKANKAIYEVARDTYRKHEKWAGGSIRVSSREPSLVYARSQAEMGRAESLGLQYRGTPSRGATPANTQRTPIDRPEPSPVIPTTEIPRSPSPANPKSSGSGQSKADELRESFTKVYLNKFKCRDMTELPEEVQIKILTIVARALG